MHIYADAIYGQLPTYLTVIHSTNYTYIDYYFVTCQIVIFIIIIIIIIIITLSLSNSNWYISDIDNNFT